MATKNKKELLENRYMTLSKRHVPIYFWSKFR